MKIKKIIGVILLNLVAISCSSGGSVGGNNINSNKPIENKNTQQQLDKEIENQLNSEISNLNDEKLKNILNKVDKNDLNSAVINSIKNSKAKIDNFLKENGKEKFENIDELMTHILNQTTSEENKTNIPIINADLLLLSKIFDEYKKNSKNALDIFNDFKNKKLGISPKALRSNASNDYEPIDLDNLEEIIPVNASFFNAVNDNSEELKKYISKVENLQYVSTDVKYLISDNVYANYSTAKEYYLGANFNVIPDLSIGGFVGSSYGISAKYRDNLLAFVRYRPDAYTSNFDVFAELGHKFVFSNTSLKIAANALLTYSKEFKIDDNVNVPKRFSGTMGIGAELSHKFDTLTLYTNHNIDFNLGQKIMLNDTLEVPRETVIYNVMLGAKKEFSNGLNINVSGSANTRKIFKANIGIGFNF